MTRSTTSKRRPPAAADPVGAGLDSISRHRDPAHRPRVLRLAECGHAADSDEEGGRS
jgi:hypothetical protein